jgi:hypothetical protein
VHPEATQSLRSHNTLKSIHFSKKKSNYSLLRNFPVLFVEIQVMSLPFFGSTYSIIYFWYPRIALLGWLVRSPSYHWRKLATGEAPRGGRRSVGLGYVSWPPVEVVDLHLERPVGLKSKFNSRVSCWL